MRVPNVGEEFGRYRLDRVLGQGGMGIVFAATDLRLQRTVALKVITGVLADSPEFRARFQAEAAALARLDSPYVIAIHDHDEVDGTPYIVTQFVDGTDLWSHLRTVGAMPARNALQLAAQLARGLADAHRVGVIHRDVKPGNVLLRNPGTPDQHAYLCDFGIARSEGIDGPAPTATGMVAGTWSYLSPERTIGGAATPGSDVYALACVLWVCLTGAEPYAGTDVQIALAHQQAPIPRLPGTGAFIDELNAVFARALAKDPAQRYPDAGSFRADLERLAAQAPVDTVEGPSPVPAAGAPGAPGAPAAATVVSSPGRGARAARSPRRRWPVAVAAVLTLAVVGGVATWAVLRGDDDPASADPAAEETQVRGDLDGDGYGDVLIHQERFGASAPLSVWRVASTGLQFRTPERAPAEDGDALLGDVDEDGRPDLVWLDTSEDNVVAVLVDPAEGEPWTASLPVDPAFNISGYDAVLADLTGDDRDDLVLLGDPYDGPHGLHVAVAEDGGFAAPEQWYRSELAQSLFWGGDFDGDGTDELAYWGVDEADGAEGEGGTEILKLLSADDGSLVETDSRTITGPAVNPSISQWVVGDVDDDGADELVAIGVTRRSIFVYEVADGAFTPRTRWHHTQRSAEEAREQIFGSDVIGSMLSDVDGDGDEDLVELRTTEGESLTLTVQLSDGSAFGDAQDWGTLPCGAECEDRFYPVL